MRMCLAMVTADGGERRFLLERSRIVLGRDRRCDLRVSIPTVARRHCQIIADNGVLRLEDLGSEGGTAHNGTPVTEAVLAPDDRITIGPVTFIIRADTGGEPSMTVAEVKPAGRRRSDGATERRRG